MGSSLYESFHQKQENTPHYKYYTSRAELYYCHSPLSEVNPMRDALRILVISALLSSLSLPLMAAEVFYIAPGGNDSWSGKIASPVADRSDGPFASLNGAQQAIRKLKQNNSLTSPVKVVIKNGIYQMDKPIAFSPEDSGTRDCPITYEAEKGAHPVFSGGRVIKGWKSASNGLWTAQIPEVSAGKWNFSQLFVNGRRATRARTPNTGYFKMRGFMPALSGGPAGSESSALIFNKGDIKNWSNPNDINVVIWHLWETSRLRIATVDTVNNTVRFNGYAQLNTFLNYLPDPSYYVENFFEALDAPGEWFLNNKTGVLYYKPMPGEDMKTAQIVAPYLPRLMRLAGDPGNGQYVEYINMNGLTFEYSDWTLEALGHGDGQAAVSVEATIQANGVRNCSISHCKIAHIGTYGIWLRYACMDNRIEFTEVADTGAGGVRIGTEGIVQVAAEKTSRNTVYSSYIHAGGKVYPGAIGVWIGQSPGNTISHCEIADHNYTGISIGWTWGYTASDTAGTTTEYNHIHHLGQGLLNDMGGIYNLGASPGSRISNNLIHDVSGGGIYPDEGSAQLLINNNVAYRTLNGGFSLHYGKDNIVRNNIFAMSFLHQVMRYQNEEHRAITFENNIVYYDHGDVMGSGTLGKYDDFDKNLYWNTSKKPVMFPGDITFTEWKALGRDINTLIADPLFVDPKHDNYTLEPGSPAFKLGFQSIDLSQSGLVGDKDWVNLPKRDKLKRLVVKTATKPAELLVNDDFESSLVGLRAFNTATLGETAAATIRVTDEFAASGKHSLKFTDAPGLDYYFNPHIFYQPRFTNCIARVSFDLRMEPGAMFWHEWRDDLLPYNTGPSMGVDASGELTASEQKLLTLPHSQWVHFVITCGLGNKSTHKYALEITLPGEKVRRFDNLPCSQKFERFDYAGFISTAKDKEVFYIDNLKIEKVGK